MRVKKQKQSLISCLGTSFNQPIADLVAKLLKSPLAEDAEVRPRTSDVNYSVCLVVMLVVAFESWVARARHFDARTFASMDEKSHVLPWLKALKDPKLKAVVDRLDEIYFVRDAIVHNHIWTFAQFWNAGQAFYCDFDIDSRWQSKPAKIRRIILETLPSSTPPRTRKLGISVVPGFVGRRDVAIVFKTVKDALIELEKLGYATVVPKTLYVQFDGKLSFPFWKLISVLQKSSMGK